MFVKWTTRKRTWARILYVFPWLLVIQYAWVGAWQTAKWQTRWRSNSWTRHENNSKIQGLYLFAVCCSNCKQLSCIVTICLLPQTKSLAVCHLQRAIAINKVVLIYTQCLCQIISATLPAIIIGYTILAHTIFLCSKQRYCIYCTVCLQYTVISSQNRGQIGN